jgi:hypothetical protein
MTTQSYYLYLRGLRQVDHTVFCVADGQKTYRDPLTGRLVPYSSGQQVKRSILDDMTAELSENRSPVTFNFTLSKKAGNTEFKQGEPWSPCNPAYADQLIGGWMRAGKEGAPVKRRSPLSISALRPLHPTLSGLAEESVTFDRSDHPEQHTIRVMNDQGKEVSKEEFLEFLKTENRNAPMRLWIPSDKVGSRASGLFIYDVAIDLRTLFSVSLNTFEPELSPETVTQLKEEGWHESPDGTRLICPGTRREQIIPALAHSLIYWRVTSNQSRTYSPQNTLAVAMGHNANRLGAAIRAELTEASDYKRAEPILDTLDGVNVYTALTAKAYIREVIASKDALERAEEDLRQQLLGYNYDA